ncbi:MAG: hypothetical protein GF403_11630 [Candidatus Coatesbacteria bacterium]|nr:hypothetical protein [Candidatus Coatesbacteria bacterium]
MAENSPFTPLPGAADAPGGRHYRKEIARVGEYEHPDGALHFDLERLSAWATAFEEARGAGVRIPVPLAHSAEPTANAGWVEALELDTATGVLYAVIEITRSEVAELIDNGSIRYTSLALGPLADDAGNFWEEAVLEVSLVTEPHVRRQGPFVTLAGDRGVVRELAAARRENAELRRELAAFAAAELNEEVDELIARGRLAPADREGLLDLAAGLDPERRERLLASYRRRGVNPGAESRPTLQRDDETAALARRFGLEPEELDYYLENRSNRPLA